MERTYSCVIALLAGVILAFGSATAAAADPGFYLGGSIGSSLVEDEDDIDIEDEVEEFDLDDDDFGWKAYVGFQFLPWLGVEGGYVDFGEVEESTTNLNVSAGLDGWDAFAVGTIPIAFVDLFAKVGVISYDIDVDFDTDDFDDSFSSSGEDLAYGVGAAVNLGNFGIRAEAERFDISDIDDLYLLSVGAVLRF